MKKRRILAVLCGFAATGFIGAGVVYAMSQTAKTGQTVEQSRQIPVQASEVRDTMSEDTQTAADYVYLRQLAVDSGMEAAEWADKSRELKLPVTRGSTASVFSQAHRIGLLDQWVNKKVFETVLPNVEYDYGKAAMESLNLNHTVTRGEWAHIAMQWKNALQLPDFTCCMGDKPDFSDLDDKYIYAKDVKAAARSGLYCTREKTRVEAPLTMYEINKYIWKLASIQPTEVFKGTTDYTKYTTVEEFMQGMVKESGDESLPGVYQEMIYLNFQSGLLPLDYMGRMNLFRELTIKDLTTILINCSDLHLTYAKLAKDNEVCVACSYLGVESYYDEIIKRLAEK